ncbi:MAG: glycosyltransferase family 4 protein, partial [Nitrospinae bacterium]|nr:glycosyltransferase family 4 protein [Nitrospinota bacterium]
IMNPGIDINSFPSKEEIVAIRKKKKEKIKLVSAGRFVSKKAFERGIEVVHELVKKGLNVEYEIIGDGEDKEKYLTLIKKYNVEKQVTISPFIPVDQFSQLVEKYVHADFFVMLGRYDEQHDDIETFGIVYIEANMSGCPVIACDVGGVSDAVSDGKNGFLFQEYDSQKIAEKMNSLINDEAALDSLFTSSRNWGERFLWDALIEKSRLLS